ncbi:hypothetical protein TNCV_2223781 [Trichonephila clavipes]|nr:hypothetical protein TNCV_2223781 [Trichonephila clavipes]
MVDLSGYVICALIRPKGVLWDLDRGSEKASPVFEHPIRQTTSVKASMCEWSSYPSGREMGLPRNIVIEFWECSIVQNVHIHLRAHVSNHKN